jgi:exopolysaccharide production protein ExoY
MLQRIGIERLPQLWNVVRGDMSLVGPPPLSRIDIDQMDLATLECRFNFRPGLISESVNVQCLEDNPGEHSLGSEYVSGWSLLGDLKTLAKAFTIDSRVPGVAVTEADAL